MGTDENWIEHRRGDGERVGWMVPDGEGFIVIDLLGRRRSEQLDWLAAEEALDQLGIGYLADPFELKLESGQWQRVRLLEVSPAGIRVKKDDWGDMTARQVEYTLGFPMPADLRPLEGHAG